MRSTRRRVLPAASAALAAGAALVLAVASCGDDGTSPEDAPPGHTVFKDGRAHRPGLENPTVNCVECHGANLMGGANGEPSCFTCHGQEWP